MEPETFLRAAVQGKMHVIEKFLADGGSPDTCDEVASLAATGWPLPCHQALQPCPTMPVGGGWDPWDRAGGTTRLGGEDASICQCATLSPSSTAQPCTAPHWRDTWKSCRSCWTVGPLLTSETG